MNNSKLAYCLLSILLCTSCTRTKEYYDLTGLTMGPIRYNITAELAYPEIAKAKIDSLLDVINSELSIYIDSSTISDFNKNKKSYTVDKEEYDKNPHFIDNFLVSKEIHRLSNGDFDPSIKPIIDYWGFGKDKKAVSNIDSTVIDSLMSYVGLGKMVLHENRNHYTITKDYASCQLDFGAIAKGYAVDQVSTLLREMGCTNHLVEIGGEVRAYGQNPRNSTWKIGVTNPQNKKANGDYIHYVNLDNQSMATSGDYNIYYELKGQKYSHITDTKTGYPKRNKLLSATVIGQDCIKCDALATACIVKDVDKALTMINTIKGYECALIYIDTDGQLNTKYSSHFEKYITKTM